MKENRKSLSEYYGKQVAIIGTYVGEYNHRTLSIPELEEKTNLEYDPKNNLKVPTCITSNQCAEAGVWPVKFVGVGSIVNNIVGTEGNEDIVEDHMILMNDLPKTFGIINGERVIIRGRVGAYAGGNKVGGYDYCMTEIYNCERVNKN